MTAASRSSPRRHRTAVTGTQIRMPLATLREVVRVDQPVPNRTVQHHQVAARDEPGHIVVGLGLVGLEDLVFAQCQPELSVLPLRWNRQGSGVPDVSWATGGGEFQPDLRPPPGPRRGPRWPRLAGVRPGPRRTVTGSGAGGLRPSPSPGRGQRRSACNLRGPRSDTETDPRASRVIAAVRSAASCVKSGMTTADRCWPAIECGRYRARAKAVSLVLGCVWQAGWDRQRSPC